MAQIIAIIVSILLGLQCANAETYWVSASGAAANLAACSGETPLDGTDACARTKALAGPLTPGDTVYFRAGNATEGYVISGSGLNYEGIKSSDNGTPGSPITFKSYNTEVVILTSNNAENTYGFYLDDRSYVKIEGITFQDFPSYGHFMSSDHNEITLCIFQASNSDGEDGNGIWFVSNCGDGTNYNCWNTHNWLHHNVISKRVKAKGITRCDEGKDLIRIGDDDSGSAPDLEQGNNFNTIEYNLLYHTNHTIIDTYGNYGVIRGNVIHNEPWYDNCTNWDSGGISSDSFAVSTGVKTGTTQAGLSLSAGASKPITLVKSDDYSIALYGNLDSYNSGTGAFQVTVSAIAGSGGPYNSWKIADGQVPYYTNSAYNGLYGHRNIQLSDGYARERMSNLVEGNRLGHAGMNPNNDGAENLTLAGPGNIIRYNFLYNSMASGIAYKYADGDCIPGTKDHPGACGGINNRIFNNTIYKSGTGINWRIYGANNMSYAGQGIAQARSAGTGNLNNVIKNNILYDNKEGAICLQTLNDGDYTTSQCSAMNYDTVTHNMMGGTGDSPTNDPLFVNPDLTTISSQHLFSGQAGYATTPLPDLSLQASSSAIDGNTTSLTLASGAGDNNVTLHVDDALYFQDGTWGSDLTRTAGTMQADWIAIGTVSNVVQISSIDYATNTIILAEAKSWADDAPVWLYKKSDGEIVLYGSAPDYGAYEYQDTSPTTSTSHASGSFNLR